MLPRRVALRLSRALGPACLAAACATATDPSGLAPPSAAADPSRDGQHAAVGTALAVPLRVLVTRAGVPAAGVAVTWLADPGAGTLTPTTAVTDAQGAAEAIWRLDTVAGTWRARATVAGLTLPVTFTASARAGQATAIASATGPGFVGVVARTAPHAVQMLVTDRYGNPVPAHPVTWRVAQGALGTLLAAPTTDARGVSSPTLAFTAVGEAIVHAEATGLAGSPRVVTIVSRDAPVGVVEIEIGNDHFLPDRVVVSAGTLVRWTMRRTSGAAHNVTPDALPAFGGTTIDLIGDGTAWEALFGAPGTYRYLCTRHGRMTGTIVVE